MQNITSIMPDHRDPTAFHALYHQYSPALFGEIIRVVKCEKTSCSILKQVFLEIYQDLDKHDPEKNNIFTWMFLIARNRAMEAVSTQGPDDNGFPGWDGTGRQFSFTDPFKQKIIRFNSLPGQGFLSC